MRSKHNRILPILLGKSHVFFRMSNMLDFIKQYTSLRGYNVRCMLKRDFYINSNRFGFYESNEP